MAEQTLQLYASGYSVDAGRVQWREPRPRRQIDSSLTENGVNRHISVVQARSNGNFVLSLTGSANIILDVVNQDLSDEFEANGSITIEVGAFSLTVELNGADTSDTYVWAPDNSAEVTQFYNDVSALSGDQAATLTIRDFVQLFRIGNTAISKTYVGGTEIAKGYVGSVNIY